MVYGIKKALNKVREEKEMKKQLPQAIYQTASVITFSDYEEAVRMIAESDYGALSEKFKKALKNINSKGFEKALEELMKETSSEELKNFLEVLLTGYETGEDVHDALIRTADSILSKRVMEEQQAASTLMQKYTILLSSLIIVPLLLGIVIALVNSVNVSSLLELNALLREEALSLMITADYAYITLNYLISAVFASLLSNDKNLFKRLPLIIISIALFTLAKSIRIL